MVMCFSTVSHADDKTVQSAKIIHEDINQKPVNIFLEDVTLLLPPELASLLDQNSETFLKDANFRIKDDYWYRKVMPKDVFRRRLELITINDPAELASQLGGTVRYIFEISLRPSNNDVMGELLKKNLREIPIKWKSEKVVIKYDGYNGQPIAEVLDDLYRVNKSSKANLYPEMVINTAKLWTAIWKKGGGNTPLVTKTIEHKPIEIEFRKSTPMPVRR